MDYKKLIDERNDSSNFAKLLGAEVIEISEGEATATMPVKKEMINGINTIHGGCLFTLADLTTGAAAHSFGLPATTVDYSFHFLRPAMGTIKTLVAKAKAIKNGKRLIVLNVEVFDENGILLAAGTATHMPVDIKK